MWWLIPILATACAIVWVWWRTRDGASQEGRVTSAKELEKMSRALNKPLPERAVPPTAQQHRNAGSEVPPEQGEGHSRG